MTDPDSPREPMSVAEWVDRYYRPDRLRGDGRRGRVIEDRESDLREHGRAMISRHESVTGSAVVLYDPTWRPAAYLRWAATYTDEGSDDAS